MDNVFFVAENLEAARAAGVAASFIETRTSQEKGSSYTSVHVLVLLNGEKWARLLAVVPRTNGGYDYAEQLARDATRSVNVGLEGYFTFRTTIAIKKTDHFTSLKHSEMLTQAEAVIHTNTGSN